MAQARPPCREEDEPFIRNAISRDKPVHDPIVRHPAHPRRLVGVLVIGQIAGVPSLFCQRMSDLPSPLKSSVPLISQFGPGLNEPAAPTETARSLLSLTLLFDPSSTGPALVLASAIGSFLIALISLIERRRMVALNTQIGELTDRLANLEVAESRRLAIEVRTKTRDVSQGLAKDVQRTADSLRSPPLSLARLSEFSATRET